MQSGLSRAAAGAPMPESGVAPAPKRRNRPSAVRQIMSGRATVCHNWVRGHGHGAARLRVVRGFSVSEHLFVRSLSSSLPTTRHITEQLAALRCETAHEPTRADPNMENPKALRVHSAPQLPASASGGRHRAAPAPTGIGQAPHARVRRRLTPTPGRSTWRG